MYPWHRKALPVNLPPSKVLVRAVDHAELEAINKVRETDGPNDSPRIREYQAVCNQKPPAAYCGCGIAWAIEKSCKEFGAKLKKKYYSAWTPTFYNLLPVKLHSKRDKIQRGDIAFFYNKTKGRISHVEILRGDLRPDGKFKTVGFNTNPGGSDSGDGVYFVDRVNGPSVVFARFTDEHVEFPE